MRRSMTMGATMALMILVMAAPTAAARPERFEEHFTIQFPDVDRGLVVLVNTTRDEYCTQGVVDWELAVIAWLEGGEVGPFPPDPDGGFPEGNDPIATQIKETGQGALVWHQKAAGMDAEIWPMVADPPLVGPCTDTDADDTPVLVGTARYQGNANDIEGSGTRGNTFGDRGSITGRDADGERHTYSWRFHVNDRCFVPEGGPPRCEIVRSSFD